MTWIKSIKAIQVLDSIGLPTISCNVVLGSGVEASAMVPSGASTGAKEALELRDGGSPYLGKGVEKAVDNINNIISPLIIKLDPRDQKLIDQKLIDLDGTHDKSKLGANAILAVSLAVSHAAAIDKKIPLHRSEEVSFLPSSPFAAPISWMIGPFGPPPLFGCSIDEISLSLLKSAIVEL